MASTKKDEKSNPATVENSGMKGSHIPTKSTDDSASSGKSRESQSDTAYVPDEQGRSGEHFGRAQKVDPLKEQIDSGDQTEEQRNTKPNDETKHR